jgi:hypothetical protein
MTYEDAIAEVAGRRVSEPEVTLIATRRGSEWTVARIQTVQPPQPLAVPGIALEVSAVSLQHALIGAMAELVDMAPDRGNASCDERLAQTLRRQR